MSHQQDTDHTVAPAPKVPRHKLLARARKQLMQEFQLKDNALELISNQLGQEPYNMVRSRNGSKPSTRWSCTIEQIWTWNNGRVVDKKERATFQPTMNVDGQNFNRRDLIAEAVTRADIHNSIRAQIKSLGYPRCFSRMVWRSDHSTGEEYETMMIQVPV